MKTKHIYIAELLVMVRATAHALLHRNRNIFFKLGLFLEENEIEIYMRFI